MSKKVSTEATLAAPVSSFTTPSSTPSAVAPASSLPPRPPQVSARRTPAPIVPALPISLLGPKKPYQAPGIGRGHSSLPPKPAFPGKPLPRDTDAIVLTPGEGDGPPGYTSSTKPKRVYSTTPSESTMRPMDPAVTNLTPQNRVSPSATNHHNHGPRTITPPADSTSTTPRKPSLLHTAHHEPTAHAVSLPHTPSNADGNHPYTPYGDQQPVLVNGIQHQYRGRGDVPMHPHHDLPQHMHGFHQPPQPPPPPPPEMFGMTHGPFGMHHPGYAHHPHHHQSPFQPVPQYPGTLTPPNTASLFLPPAPPPIQPHHNNNNFIYPDNGPNIMSHSLAMEAHRGPFTRGSPPLPGDVHAYHHTPSASTNGAGSHGSTNGMMYSHSTPHTNGTTSPIGVQRFPPPPPQHLQQLNENRLGPPKPASYAAHPTLPAGETINQDIDGLGKKLNGISFFPRDDGDTGSQSDRNTPAIYEGERMGPLNFEPGHPHMAVGRIAWEMDSHLPAPARMERHMTSMFWNSRFSDVWLAFKNPETGYIEHFPSHMLVLGQSEKLSNILGQKPALAFKDNLQDGSYEQAVVQGHPPLTMASDDKRLIMFPTTVPREAFLAVLKTLYGHPDWVVDAYIDDKHPSREGHPGAYMMEEGALVDSKTHKVRMFENSVSLFLAAIVLGSDAIVHRAFNSMKRFGLDFADESFERLLKFIIFEAPQLRTEPILASYHWQAVDFLANDAVQFLLRNLPMDFKMDPKAPGSRYISSLPNLPHSPQALTPIAQVPRSRRRIYSTIFVSIPFELLKSILEHPELPLGNDSQERNKRRREIASGVIQERERRRKREIKWLQENNADSSDGDKSPESPPIVAIKPDETNEILFWEESVVTTFGNGVIGIEITKRRKGGPGGRMLWKVGKKSG